MVLTELTLRKPTGAADWWLPPTDLNFDSLPNREKLFQMGALDIAHWVSAVCDPDAHYGSGVVMDLNRFLGEAAVVLSEKLLVAFA